MTQNLRWQAAEALDMTSAPEIAYGIYMVREHRDTLAAWLDGVKIDLAKSATQSRCCGVPAVFQNDTHPINPRLGNGSSLRSEIDR